MTLHEQIETYYPQYSDIQHYPADQCACIRKTKEEWGLFGNFYKADMVIDGVTFDCTERLFHLMKFKPSAADGLREEYGVKAGMAIKMHMKTVYNNHPEWLRDDWGAMVVDAMKYCLVKKYEHCELFRQELERSKGLFIVEDETARNARRKADASSWGVNLEGDEYVGPSLLGRLLMALRDNNGHLDYHLPDDALDFIAVIRNNK